MGKDGMGGAGGSYDYYSSENLRRERCGGKRNKIEVIEKIAKSKKVYVVELYERAYIDPVYRGAFSSRKKALVKLVGIFRKRKMESHPTHFKNTEVFISAKDGKAVKRVHLITEEVL